MDSLKWNKIAGAILGSLILVLVIRFGVEALFEVEPPAKEAYHVEGVLKTASSGSPNTPTVEEAVPDFGTALPAADLTAGKAVSARCEQCHDISKGGPNKIGPELWNVVGRPRAAETGFSYSSAMASEHAVWSYENLFKFLKSPPAIVPGTKMSFAGLRSASDRINLLAFLRMQADSPAPLPPPAPAKAPTTPEPK